MTALADCAKAAATTTIRNAQTGAREQHLDDYPGRRNPIFAARLLEDVLGGGTDADANNMTKAHKQL